MSEGQVAAAAVAALRERTSLPAPHAVQLLRATNGVVDTAVELYLAAPDMFADSQAACASPTSCRLAHWHTSCC